MTTRCQRIHKPLLQFLRHASTSGGSFSQSTQLRGGRKFRQRVVNQQTVLAPSGGKGSAWRDAPLKATYEPSPIFGVVKPTSKEALKKPTTRMQTSKSKPKSASVKPTKPMSEDEKMYTYKSFKLKTSVKKLGNLTRQIAHKDIDYAITQMRFSPKRAARSILRGLEHAKEEAIRLQGMKEGHIIVDQAWVGRNAYKKQIWPRAKGRMNIRMRPYTHFTVVLRTAETVNKRIEKVKTRKLEKLVRPQWERRPIYNPRPYYTW